MPHCHIDVHSQPVFSPALSFYLIAVFIAANNRARRSVFPILALTSAFAILWNFDSGIVVFGAVPVTSMYEAPAAGSGIKLMAASCIFLFAIGFAVLMDGAFSMVGCTSSIHSVSWKNAYPDNLPRESYMRYRGDFIKQNIPLGDTVIIFATHFESYYYTLGNYYNPVPVPSSTEMFFKSELYSVLDVIRQRKYPVIYDPNFQSLGGDTIIKTLRVYAYQSKLLVPDGDLIIWRPRKIITQN